MKRNFFLNAIVVMLIAALASCSKEKMPVDPGPADPVYPGPLNEKLLVKVSQDGEERTIEYYPDRKIKTITRTSPVNPTRRFEFTYGLETVTVTDFVNNVKEGTSLYEVNAKGYAGNSIYKQFDPNGNLVYESWAVHFYNNDNQLIKEEFNTGDSYTYTYVNGNLSEFKKFQGNQLVWQSKYEYYTDKFDKHLSYGQFNSNGLGAIRPKLAKNLIKHQVVTDPVAQTTVSDMHFTYEFDNEGFIKKGKWVDVLKNISSEWTNTFQ